MDEVEDTPPSQVKQGTPRPGRWVAATVVAMVVLFAAVGLLTLQIGWWSLTPSERVASVEQTAIEAANAWRTPRGEELQSAQDEHFQVSERIANCFSITLTNSEQTFSNFIAFSMWPQPSGGIRAPGTPGAAPPPPLNSYQRSLVYLSDAISRARGDAAAALSKHSTRANWLQWASVIIGALVTILVSVKAIVPANNSWSTPVGVLAIVFSALGTACAGMIAFYGSGESVARTQRTLIQLRELHRDMAFAVVSTRDMCRDVDVRQGDLPEIRDLRAFAARFNSALQTSSPASAGTQQGNAAPGPQTNIPAP
jgi:hypothetical protein